MEIMDSGSTLSVESVLAMRITPLLPPMAQIAVENTPDNQKAFLLLVACWIPLGIASLLFFFLNRNAALKRKVLPIFATVVGILFGAFVFYMTRGSLFALALIVPMIVLITVINIRTTRFCDACGRTLIRQSLFSRPGFCSQCGAPLR